MEVGVIYRSESTIDENNNFKIEFRNEQEIVELLFKEKRDYYLANAIAFVKNKFDEDIIELEEKINKAETSFPFPQIEIDYSSQFLLDKRINKYAYVLEDTTKNYLKQITYFDTKNEVVKKTYIYDVIERLTDGISYINKAKTIQDLYTKIEFKLTPARKIEIKLTDSVNKIILYHYYYTINSIFVRGIKRWITADIDWFPHAQKIYSRQIKRNPSNRFLANVITLKYIWNYYKNRPNSEVIGNGINYNANRNNVILFYGFASESNSRYYHVSFEKANNGPYTVYVSPESNWYKKRSYNIFRFFSFEGIIDNTFESLGPVIKLAKFINRSKGGSFNEDFTQGWTMPTDMEIEKKIIGDDILQTDSFSGKEKQKDLTPSALDKYKLDNLKISGNHFTDLNKTIKPTEFAFFLYENLNIIK